MRLRMFFVVAPVLLIGCSGGSNPPVETSKGPVHPPADPATLGSITGKVVYSGPKVEPKTISMDAQPICARQHSGPIYSEEVIVNPNGTMKNAFVYIKTGLVRKHWPTTPTPVKLDQKGCIYTPHVAGVMVNQALAIYNSDDTNHNV